MLTPPSPSPPAGRPQYEDADLWRRGLARFVDWLLVGTLTAWLFWPAAARELPEIGVDAGLTGVFNFIATHAFGHSVSAGTDEAIHGARELLAQTFALQVLVVLLYEWVATTMFGATIGKAVLRVRVRFAASSAIKTALPAAARAALAVVPGGAALSAALVMLTGSWTAFGLAVFFAAVAAFDFSAVLSDGEAKHDAISSSRAVNWDVVARTRSSWRPRHEQHPHDPGPMRPGHNPFGSGPTAPEPPPRPGPPHQNPYG